MRQVIAACCAALLFLLPVGARAQVGEKPIGPTIGHVGTSTAWLWVRAPGVETASVTVDGGAARKLPLQVVGRGFARIVVDGLTPDARHRLAVSLPDQERPTLLAFRTAPPARSWGKVSLGVGSCLKYAAQPVWDTVAKLDLDLFLWLGDNVYYRYRKGGKADWDRLDWMLERQLEGRDRPNLLRVMRKMACYAIWDDHDYGPNDSDRHFPLKAEARVVHRYMWAANPGFGQDDEGVYFRFRRGPVELFMLDDRWFKEVRRQTPPAQRTLYGKEQLAWLRRGIEHSDAPLKVIAAGVQQVLGYPGAEGWDQAPIERRRFMDWLRKQGSRVVFLSGDVHVSELYEVSIGGGRKVWELTSSGLANKTPLAAVFKAVKRPERKWIETKPNVCTMVVDIPPPPRPVSAGTISFRCLSVDGTLRHETKTRLASFGGKAKAKERHRSF